MSRTYTRVLVASLLAASCVQAAGDLGHIAQPGRPELAGLADVLALLDDGQLAEGEAAARALLAETEAREGTESLASADVIDVLVDALSRAGGAGESGPRQLAERALAIREKLAGPDDPEVAKSLDSLAHLLADSGDYRGARPLYERGLRLREMVLGPDHPDVGKSLNNLGILLAAIGDYASAKPLYERALSIREKAFGPASIPVASVLNNLAILLRKTGDYDEAKQVYERTLAIYESLRGRDHPDMATTLDNLGALFSFTGDYESSRPYLERALAIREKAFGPRHSYVATSLNNLASLLVVTGDHAGAKPLYERALTISETALGPNHPEVATGLNNLAAVLLTMGDYAKARPLYERALAIDESVFGLDNPECAHSLAGLASLLRASGDFAAARPLFERSLAIHERSLGPDHPEVANSLTELAILLCATGGYADAQSLFERALMINEKVLGTEHSETARSLSNLAGLRRAMRDPTAAKVLHERAQATWEKALGPYHPHVARNLADHAAVSWELGDLAGARRLYARALAVDEKALGPDHPDVADVLNNLGMLLVATGDDAAAASMYERALAIRETALGPNHPHVAATLNNIAVLAYVAGDAARAEDLSLRAEAISREHLLLTSRTLGQRQALRYATVRTVGLDVAISVAVSARDNSSLTRAWDSAVRSRALVLDEMSARRRHVVRSTDPRVGSAAQEYASAAQRFANLTVRGPGGELPKEYRTLLDDARKEMERTEQVLATASAPFREDQARSRLGLAEVTAALPRGDALLAFLRYDQYATAATHEPTPNETETVPPTAIPSYAAFILRGGEQMSTVVPLGPAGSLEALISRWRAEVANPRTDESSCRAAGEALRRATWDRVVPHVAETQRVFVVLDAALHLVTFAALPSRDGKYLVESGPTIHYVSTERDLVPPSSPPKPGEGLLALGGVDYAATDSFAKLASPPQEPGVIAALTRTIAGLFRGEHSSCGTFKTLRFAPLAATDQEVKDVVAAWRKATRALATHLSGNAASEAHFKAGAPRKSVLHLATHGFFLGQDCPSATSSADTSRGLVLAGQDEVRLLVGENPLVLSGLALAGANNREAALPMEEDGILTAEEVASLDLSGVEWAVLSACDTGLGDITAGEGVFGLRRAFQVAGARTVIMSLWPVEDETTRQWMTALYEARLARRFDTAACVREASVALLSARRAEGLSTHPFYWGGFVAAGDWH